jgi:L,D-transpeptidase ErfK/SrfK
LHPKFKREIEIFSSIYNLIAERVEAMKKGIFIFIGWISVILLIMGAASGLFYFVLTNVPDKLSAVGIERVKYPQTFDGAEKQIKLLKKKLSDLQAKNTKGKGENYIIINTTENSFKLYKDGKLIRKGLCSTGKDELLIGPNGKKFLFKTPRGVLTVKSKQEDPVWVRPDWDFIEQGQKIPSAHAEERYDYATLGKYKLELGDGYKLHGTLYQRFIGQPVTHGCVRFLDDDLEVIYKTLSVKSKVYIY